MLPPSLSFERLYDLGSNLGIQPFSSFFVCFAFLPSAPKPHGSQYDCHSDYECADWHTSNRLIQETHVLPLRPARRRTRSATRSPPTLPRSIRSSRRHFWRCRGTAKSFLLISIRFAIARWWRNTVKRPTGFVTSAKASSFANFARNAAYMPDHARWLRRSWSAFSAKSHTH